MALVLSVIISLILSISAPFYILGVWLDSSNNIGDDVGPAEDYVRKLKFEVRKDNCSYSECCRLVNDHTAQDRKNDIEHAPEEKVLDKAPLDKESFEKKPEAIITPLIYIELPSDDEGSR